MLTLRELQREFFHSMVGDAAPALVALIAGDGIDSASRLNIYRNNVWTRLTEALRSIYPVVCELTDQRFFYFATDAFIRRHPPTTGCLAEYGADFPAFLATFPAASTLQYLPDVARLEWCIHRIRRAPVVSPITIADLAGCGIDPADIRLNLTPRTAYIKSVYGVDRLWAAHQQPSSPEAMLLETVDVRLQVNAHSGIAIVRLEPATWEFRARLANGDPLGSAVSRAMTVSPRFDTTLALASLFNEGCVVGRHPARGPCCMSSLAARGASGYRNTRERISALTAYRHQCNPRQCQPASGNDC